MGEAHPLDVYPDDETGDERQDWLVLLDRGRTALAQARTLPDVGDVMAVAERARRYARAAKLGLDAENHAMRLRLDAERKAGQILAVAPKHEGGRPGENRSQNGTGFVPTLADLGLTKRQSSDWQALATLPEGTYREHVERDEQARRPLRTRGLVEVARKIARDTRRAAPPPPPVHVMRPDVQIERADATHLPVADATVDLIVTSPPYGLAVPYEGGDIAADAWPSFMSAWLGEALRVTKPSGRLALNVPLDTSEPTYRPTYAEAVVAATLAGWEYRSTIVWAEGNTRKGGWALGSQASAARPHHVSQVEMIGLFSNGVWGPSSAGDDDITPDQFLEAGRGPWTFSGESRAWEGHPAPFPIELPRRLIRYLCRVGDVVLDPFLGSGTTAKAALDLGRVAWGFDISETYVESARRRVAAGAS